MAGAVAQALRLVVRGYQLSLSPAITAIGVRCRHEPTCSHYARDALERHGAWLGVWMTLARVLRCRPGGSSGYDPVPDELDARATPAQPWRAADWRGPRP